jgi:hypothetical protein
MKNHEGFCVLHVLNPLVQRQDIAEEEFQLKPDIPRVGQEGGRVHPEVESAIQQARGDGQFLEGALQEQMGASLGYDFSDVRVHTGHEADELNRQLSARAFTIGTDIFFSQGTYAPASISGRKLIAHELIHVVQQRNCRVPKNGNGMTVLPDVDPSEFEANALADRLVGSIDVRCKSIVRRVGTEASVLQRALADRIKNIDDRLSKNLRNCCNAAVLWIYDELGSNPSLLDALEDSAAKIKRLVNNGSPIVYTKKKNVSVNAGDVLVFYDGSVRHVCIAMSQQVIGGYNQVGWFEKCVATDYDVAPLGALVVKKGGFFGNTGFNPKLYKIIETEALKVAKTW